MVEKEQSLDLSEGSLINLEQFFGSDPYLELKSQHASFNSTFEWTNMNTERSPSMRDGIELVSIEGYDKVILHGGGHGGAGAEQDTWIYDVGTNEWERYVFTESPGPVHSYAACNIFGTDQMVLLGGYHTYLKETRSSEEEETEQNWVFDLSEMKWTPIQVRGMEDGMRFQHMAPICGTKKALLYNRADEKDNSTYIYDHENREIIKIPIEGPPLSEPGRVAPFYGTDQMFFFWSKLDPTNINNWLTGTWIYDHGEGTWTELNPPDGPTYLYYDFNMDMLFDTHKIILFGGSWAGVKRDDTWVFDLDQGQWSMLNVSARPPGRSDHGLVNIRGTSRVMVFGGVDHHDEIGNDTYMLDLDSYSSEGSYISDIMEIPLGASPERVRIDLHQPPGTDIDIKMRSGSSGSISGKEFLGPGDLKTSSYEEGENLLPSTMEDHRFFQFSISLSTTKRYLSPILDEVSIIYTIKRENTSPVLEKLGVTFYNISDSIAFRFRVIDEENDAVDIMSYYSLDGIYYEPAEVKYLTYYPPYNLTPGADHSVLWNHGDILKEGMEHSVQFKLVPVDYSEGPPIYYGPYFIDLKPPAPDLTDLPDVVDVDDDFTIRFDEPIERGAYQNRIVILKDEYGRDIPVNVMVAESEIFVDPDDFLEHDTFHSMKIGGLFDPAGNPMHPVYYNFTTVQNNPVLVESITFNRTVLGGPGYFTVIFDRPIVDDTENRVHFLLTDMLNRSIERDVDIDDLVAIVWVRGSAPDGLRYFLLTVQRGIRDGEGNILEEDHTFLQNENEEDPSDGDSSSGFWYALCFTPAGILVISLIILKLFGKPLIRSLVRSRKKTGVLEAERVNGHDRRSDMDHMITPKQTDLVSRPIPDEDAPYFP